MSEIADKNDITENDILSMHRLFYRKIDDLNAGVYRKDQVFISGSRYPLPGPDRVPQMMKDLVQRIGHLRKNEHPVTAAAKAHLQFVFIHPFIDGNGRVARLIMNLILIQSGYNIALISPVLRAEYISSIEAAREDDRDFINLICRAVYETQKDYIRMLNA
jgi:Fic family protein